MTSGSVPDSVPPVPISAAGSGKTWPDDAAVL